MFLRLRTQWVYAGMGDIVGLNYQAVESVFRMTNVDDCEKMLSDIQIMEESVLSTLKESK